MKNIYKIANNWAFYTSSLNNLTLANQLSWKQEHILYIFFNNSNIRKRKSEKKAIINLTLIFFLYFSVIISKLYLYYSWKQINWLLKSFIWQIIYNIYRFKCLKKWNLETKREESYNINNIITVTNEWKDKNLILHSDS